MLCPLLKKLLPVMTFALAFASAGVCCFAQDLSLASRQADFKAFVQDFEENYAYLDRPEKPWATWETRYAAAVASAATKPAFDAVLAAALSELHDFHAEVRSPVPNRWLPVPTFADVWATFQDGQAVVVAVRRGSDAERAGVVVGDRVVEVNGMRIADAVRARLAGQGDDEKAGEWALLSVLAGRADEGRLLGLEGQNGKMRSVTLPIERRFDRAAGELSVEMMPGAIGVVRLNNSLGQLSTVAAFDAALVRLRATKGLVLDLRDVPSGGDSSVALGIMGRLVTTMLPYQQHRIPNYGQADIERNWIEQVAPRGPFAYTQPMIVLVDHWTGSMGEGIAIGLDAMHRATVMGTPMAHLAGAVSDFTLSQTGVRVAFATEQLFHVNGTPREAWLPPVLVEEAVGGDDGLLEKAVGVLQGADNKQTALQQRIVEIAKDAKGTMSVACAVPGRVLDCGVNAESHPPMQSVFKLPLGMLVLQQVEQGKLTLDQMVRFRAEDRILPKAYSPLWDKYPNGEVDVPLRELLRLAVSLSDNVAADILVRLVGGPKVVDAYVASLGVRGVHLEDDEKALHASAAVQYRNWFAPAGAVQLLRRIADDSPLNAADTGLLLGWMEVSVRKRLSADLPEGTKVFHKAGTSDVDAGLAHATNDIALIALPDGRRLAVAVFVTDSRADEATREAVIARIGRTVYEAAVGR